MALSILLRSGALSYKKSQFLLVVKFRLVSQSEDFVLFSRSEVMSSSLKLKRDVTFELTARKKV